MPLSYPIIIICYKQINTIQKDRNESRRATLTKLNRPQSVLRPSHQTVKSCIYPRNCLSFPPSRCFSSSSRDDCKRKKSHTTSMLGPAGLKFTEIQETRFSRFRFSPICKALNFSLFLSSLPSPPVIKLIFFLSYALLSFSRASFTSFLFLLRFNHRSSIIYLFFLRSFRVLFLLLSLWWFFTIFCFVGFFQKLMMFDECIWWIVSFFINFYNLSFNILIFENVISGWLIVYKSK